MLKFRRFIQYAAIIIILLSLLNVINPFIGFPIALILSLVLDLSYAIEYYKAGDIKMARRQIIMMICFLALLLILLYY